MIKIKVLAAVLFGLSVTLQALGDPVWVVDPQAQEPDLPPVGRSLFDHLVGSTGAYEVPFPFDSLIEQINRRLSKTAYLDRPIKKVLIPLGRSLQRDAAAPAYFASPRAVVAVDGEPADDDQTTKMLLRDRLYLGYMEDAAVLEVISYNEAAGRFEFQVVRDYREGGKKHVTYAPRRICRACHQNAAPIFARPLWDETNANAAIAHLLSKQTRDYYGIPIHQSVDIAYAIDNATDRANEFALTQYLWQTGCGTGAAGSSCRGALVVAALQTALSKGRGFDQTANNYTSFVLNLFDRARSQHWPEGLLRVDADIPNRSPMREILQNVADDTFRYGYSTDIPARFEPLSPRAAKSLWIPTASETVQTAVAGLTAFFSSPDIQQLSQHLTRTPHDQEQFMASCELSVDSQASTLKLKFECTGNEVAFKGRLYQRDNNELYGRLVLFNLRDDQLTSIQLQGRRQGTQLLMKPFSSGQLAQVRLTNGDAIESISIHLNADSMTAGTSVLTVRNDFRPVVSAIEKLVARNHDAFSDKPFRRAVALQAIFNALNVGSRDWCCIDDQHLPTAQVDLPESTDYLPSLTSFFRIYPDFPTVFF